MRKPVEKGEFIIIEITKEEVLQLELTKIDDLLKPLRRMPYQYKDTVHIVFGGYDDDPKEIFEIKAIRNWVEMLLDTYPEILFFLEEEMKALQNVLLCIAEYSAMKKLPNAVMVSPMLEKDMLIKASIPKTRFNQILFGLAKNPLSLEYQPFLTETINRIQRFAQ